MMPCNAFSLTTVLFWVVGATLVGADTSSPRACDTPDNLSGECMPLKLCQNLMDMRKSDREEDKQFLRRSQCMIQDSKVYVCCRLDGRVLPVPGVCGKTITSFIFGGTQTKIDEHPWVALIIYKNGPFKVQCGGSLINRRYVLTAAHCLESKSHTLFKVRLGEWDVTTDKDCDTDSLGNVDCVESHIDIDIENITMHKYFANENANDLNDIALIRLAQYVSYTEFIQPICLPIKDNLRNAILDGQVMEVVGWGQTEEKISSERKLKASVRVVSLNTCRKVYEKSSVFLRSSQMCAGSENGADSCKGDSGGPLIGIDNSNTTKVYSYVAGIVAHGPFPCGSPGVPAVYTRVSSYIKWIQANLEP